jgi:hypothetical protein
VQIKWYPFVGILFVVGCSRESSVEDTYSVWIQKAVYMYTSVDGWLPVLEILLLLVLGYRRECSVEEVVACCWGYFFCSDTETRQK